MNAAEQLIEQGRADGLQGLRTGVLAAFAARNVALSDVGRARLASCADVATLTRWLTSAVTATSEAAVFAKSDEP